MRLLVLFILFALGMSVGVAQVHIAVIAHEDQVLSLGVCAGIEAAASEWSTVTRRPVLYKLVGVRSPVDLESGIHSVINSSRLGIIVWATGWGTNEVEAVAEKLRFAGIPHVILDFSPSGRPGQLDRIRLGVAADNLPADAVEVMRWEDLSRIQGTNRVIVGDHPQLIPLLEAGGVTRILTTPAEEWGRYSGFQLLTRLDPEHAGFFQALPEPPVVESFDVSDIAAYKDRWRRWLAQ